MQKILIFISLLLYGVGCGTSGDTSRDTSLDTLSATSETVIKAYRTPEHIAITETATLSLEGVALDIALSEDGEFAYIASGDAGLQVVDIRDPYNPELVSLHDTPQYVNRVDVVDGIAYVSYRAQNWSDYISVTAFDVHNPWHVKNLGHYEGFQTNSHTVCEKEGLVFFVDHEGFKVVEAKDYHVIGRYDLFDTAYAFAMRDNFAFVANGRNGLTVLQAGEASYWATLTE